MPLRPELRELPEELAGLFLRHGSRLLDRGGVHFAAEDARQGVLDESHLAFDFIALGPDEGNGAVKPADSAAKFAHAVGFLFRYVVKEKLGQPR